VIASSAMIDGCLPAAQCNSVCGIPPSHEPVERVACHGNDDREQMPVVGRLNRFPSFDSAEDFASEKPS
jgi:hypothetical protein